MNNSLGGGELKPPNPPPPIIYTLRYVMSPGFMLYPALFLLFFQDTCHEVRKMFCSKLNKGLRNLHLPLGYLAIFVYSGIEPDKETKNEVSQ